MNLLEILNTNPVLSQHTDKNTTHDYINGFYEENFKQYKQKNINLLEIGICSGASLLLWNSYFENAKIYGIDVRNQIENKFNLNLNNIKLFFQDAYNDEMVNNLPNFDIIIDDGPHTLESMIFAIKNYSKKLTPNGILVIEDIQDYNWFDILIKEIEPNFTYTIIDLRKSKNRYDDMILSIKKIN